MSATTWSAAAFLMGAACAAGAANLVTNGTFNTNTSGWSSSGPGLQLVWTDLDASGSPSSGSALGTATTNEGFSIVHCVAGGIAGGARYDFSAKVRIPGYAVVAGSSAILVNWLSGPGCSGASTGSRTFSTAVQDTWVSLGEADLTAPAGTQSAQIVVRVWKTGVGGVYHTYLDDVVLNSEGAAESTQDLFLPAAAAKHGVPPTYWSTDGWFANLSSEPVTVLGAFLRPGLDNAAVVANPTTLGSLAAGGFLRLTDLVGKLGGNEETGGIYLRARAAGSGLPAELIAATSYTFTPNDLGPGNYGQGIPAEPAGTDGSVALAGVFQNSSLRTNIGALNTSAATVTIAVTVRNANGVQAGSATWALPPYSQIQVPVASLGISSLDGGSVAFQRTSAAGSFRAYSSTVDQLTGDAVYNAAR